MPGLLDGASGLLEGLVALSILVSLAGVLMPVVGSKLGSSRSQEALLDVVVQRSDVQWVGTADHIDPVYGELLREVLAAGVELIAYRAKVGRRGITISGPLPVRL